MATRLAAPLHTMVQTPDAAVVANLPYYATTAILLRLLHECNVPIPLC